MSDSLDTSLRISVEERDRRQYAIDFARGSIRLEGFVLDDQAEALFARYIAGDLDRPELNAAILRYCDIDPANDNLEPLLTSERKDS